MEMLKKIRQRLMPTDQREARLRQIWPPTLTIESSFACNLDCIMCPRSSGSFTSQEGKESALMQPTVFERLLPSLHRFHHVHLTGWGEPLANRHLLDFIRQIKEAGCEASFANNGTLLTEAAAETITDLKVNMINVSCDASTAETFNRVRGHGMFEKLVTNVKRFTEINRSKGNPTQVQWVYVMMKSNLHELADTVDLAGECGVDRFMAKHMETALTNDELSEALFNTGRVDPLTPEEQAHFDETIAECQRRAEKYPHLTFDAMPQYDPVRCDCIAAPLSLVVVDHLGNVSPCCYTMTMNTRPYQTEKTQSEKSQIFGNINQKPLEDILLEADYKRFIDTFRARKTPETCEGCVLMSRQAAPVAVAASRVG